MIGYKIAQVHKLCDSGALLPGNLKSGLNDQDTLRVLVTLEIPVDDINFKSNLNRKDIVDAIKAKYRCNKVKVLKIEDNEGTEYQEATTLSYQDRKLKYVVGEEVEEKNYNTDNEVVCGEGIHFFLDKEVALLFGLYNVKEGVYQSWYDNGQKRIECNYRDGNREGLFQSWYDNGKIIEECHYLDNKREGLYQCWWKNGQKMIECYYQDGKEDGVYQKWYDNGQKWIECIYRAGEPVKDRKAVEKVKPLK